MGKPSAPTPADPNETAGAQTSQNIGTAITQQYLNNTNQVTPDGNLTYDQTGSHSYTDPNSGEVHEIPTFTATQTLSEPQQAIRDQTQIAQLGMATTAANQSSRVNDLISNGPDLSGVPDRYDFSQIDAPNYTRMQGGPSLNGSIASAGSIQNSIAGGGHIERGIEDAGELTRSYGTDFSEDRQRVESALSDRMQSGLDRNRQSTEARLAAQGIRMGSEAYSAAQDDLSRGENDANLSAILAGGQEQSRLTGLESQRAQFENSAQSQQYGQNANDSAFNNQAQAQQFGQNATQAQFHNAAQAQQYSQNASNAAFQNQTAQQEYANRVNAVNTNNQLETQGMNAGITMGNAVNGSRSQALNEAYTGQNQELNQISTLLGGSQVQNPNFVNTPAAQLANTDYAGIVSDNYNQQMQAYNAQSNSFGSLLGGFGTILGAL